jgi:hypothetical protein
VLARLTAAHHAELRQLGPRVRALIDRLSHPRPATGAIRSSARYTRPPRR